LACTHYPLIQQKIKEYLPAGIQVVSQGDIVAHSLVDYLQRHPEMEQSITQGQTQRFFTTTDDTADFDYYAELFFGESVKSGYAEVKC
jgi:glutamate racemase